MGPNRIPKPAAEVAKEIGLKDFDPGNILNAAFPRLVDPELSKGEAGFFGNKEKLYPDGAGDLRGGGGLSLPSLPSFGGDDKPKGKGKARALPTANAPKYNPYAQRAPMRAPTMRMRGIRGIFAEAPE